MADPEKNLRSYIRVLAKSWKYKYEKRDYMKTIDQTERQRNAMAD